MAVKSVIDILLEHTDQQETIVNLLEKQQNVAPYAMAASNKKTDLSKDAVSGIGGAFEQSASGIVASIQSQNKKLESQDRKLASIYDILKDQFEYQKKRDLHDAPEIEDFGGRGGRKDFAKPKAMKKGDMAGDGLLGLLGGLGGGLGLGSLLGRGRGGKGGVGVPGKDGKGGKGGKGKPGLKGRIANIFSKMKPGTLAAGATGVAGAAALAKGKGDADVDGKPKAKTAGGAKAPKSGGVLSKLKAIGKGGGTKTKLLMAALAGTAGLIGLDWFDDNAEGIKQSLFGIDSENPEGTSSAPSIGVIGTLAAGAAGVAALISQFGSGESSSATVTAAADAKAKIVQSADDVAKSSTAAKDAITKSKTSFMSMVSEQLAKIRDIAGSFAKSVTEKFNMFKEKIFGPKTAAVTSATEAVEKNAAKVKDPKTGKLVDAADDAAKAKTGKIATATDAAKTGTKATAKGAVSSVAKGTTGAVKAVGSGTAKVLGKALPGVGIAMEGYDAYQTLTDETLTATDKSKALSKQGGGIAGAAVGAATGAAIGSVVPVVGTVIGGAVGGVAGYFAGSEGAGMVVDTINEKVEEYGVGDAIGRAVAVPMALFSDDARNALADDYDKNMKPKLEGYKDALVSFFSFGSDAEDSIEKSTAAIKDAAKSAAVTATSLVTSTHKTATNMVGGAMDYSRNMIYGAPNQTRTTNVNGTAPVIAGTTAATYNNFNTRRDMYQEDNDSFFAGPKSEFKPEVARSRSNAGPKTSSAKDVTLTTHTRSDVVESVKDKPNVIMAGPAPTVKTNNVIQIDGGQGTVTKFNKEQAPERVDNKNQEKIVKVMMVEDNTKSKKSRDPFPQPAKTTNPAFQENSYKPQNDEIPTTVQDFGLTYVNNGFM